MGIPPVRSLLIIVWLVAMLAAPWTARHARAQALPPAEFEALYSELEQRIGALDSGVSSAWDGSLAPVLFGAEVLTANSNVGQNLLAPGWVDHIKLEIDRLKALGMPAVTLSVNFPLLYKPFFPDPAEYQQYFDLYVEAADYVRASGLKLIVETQTIFSVNGTLKEYCDRLGWWGYVHARADMAVAIVRHLRPDYLTVLSEPDTEANNTGKTELNDPHKAALFVGTIVSRIARTGITSTQVGAGIGTWLADYATFATHFCRDTGIDFFALHIYPLYADNLEHIFELIQIAEQYRVPVGTGEAWLYKMSGTEAGGTLSAFDVFARNPFSFWAPLDDKLLAAMVKLAHYKRFAFFSPFWTRYFFAYLEYDDTTKDLSPEELNRQSMAASGEATQRGLYTSTALAYSTLVTAGPVR